MPLKTDEDDFFEITALESPKLTSVQFFFRVNFSIIVIFIT